MSLDLSDSSPSDKEGAVDVNEEKDEALGKLLRRSQEANSVPLCVAIKEESTSPGSASDTVPDKRMRDDPNAETVEWPRLCRLEKRSPTDEFGFNLQFELNKGHYIGAVDKGGLADKAGLETGLRIVGVNGEVIFSTTRHREVTALIKRDPLVAELLVAPDPWYTEQGIRYSLNTADVYRMKGSKSPSNHSESTEPANSGHPKPKGSVSHCRLDDTGRTTLGTKNPASNENPRSPHKLLEWESSSGEIEFDSDFWVNLLCSEQIWNKKICVVSAVGSYRNGTSRLLNFFLRYLQHFTTGSAVANIDRLTSDDNFIGFSPSSVEQRETSCIWIWPELFLLPSADGEDVAVMLADFGDISRRRESAKDHTAFSALAHVMSSITVCNERARIAKDTLAEVSELGRSAYSAGAAGMFQRLLFVVHDSNSQPGGTTTPPVERVKNLCSEQCTGTERALFEFAAHIFGEIDCFTLVGEAITRHFTEDMFAYKNLRVKQLCGRAVTCKEYCYWFCECLGRFRARSSAMCRTNDVVATVYYTTVTMTIVDNYKIAMAASFEQNPSFWREFTHIHEALLAARLEEFDSATKPGSSVFDDLHSYFRSFLQSQLNNSYDNFCETLDLMRAYSVEALVRWVNDRH